MSTSDNRTPWQIDRDRAEETGTWPGSWGPFHRHFANDAIHRDGGPECDQPGTPRRVYVFDPDALEKHEAIVTQWAARQARLDGAETPPDVRRKIYLAARYIRSAEMRGVRDTLEALGYEVISSWIDAPAAASPADRAALAATALAEIRSCDVLISFTGEPEGKRGGRHAELGYALALAKHLVVAGPREHVFHDLPQVEWYPDRTRLVEALEGAAYIAEHGNDDLETGHTRDPEGDEAAHA